MLSLNLPKYPAKVIRKAGKPFIWGALRHKYVTLTPEEWVRQHFVNYLITEKGYPMELLANEVSISLNGTTKRCDTVVYDLYLDPLMIIEYKAPHITITKEVFYQIARYNMALHVKYLLVSNGIHHYGCEIDKKKNTYKFLSYIPSYMSLDQSDSSDLK